MSEFKKTNQLPFLEDEKRDTETEKANILPRLQNQDLSKLESILSYAKY